DRVEVVAGYADRAVVPGAGDLPLQVEQPGARGGRRREPRVAALERVARDDEVGDEVPGPLLRGSAVERRDDRVHLVGDGDGRHRAGGQTDVGSVRDLVLVDVRGRGCRC